MAVSPMNMTKFLDMLLSVLISYIVTKLAHNARNNNIEKISEKAKANVKAQDQSTFKTCCSEHSKMIKFKLKFGPLKLELTIK